MENYIDTVRGIIHEIKETNTIVDIVDAQGTRIWTLEPINSIYRNDSNAVQRLMQWRNNALYAYLDRAPVTYEGTGKRLEAAIINNDMRLLFFVRNLEWDFIGHIWLYSFDEESQSCEIDNVLRWENKSPGIMTQALLALIKFAYTKMRINTLYLRVLSNNARAIELYKKNWFIENKKIPLSMSTIWWYEKFHEISEPGEDTNTEIYFLKMEYKK